MTQLPLINLCLHPGCNLPAKNKVKPGLCNKHYKRLQRYGCAHTRRTGGALALSQGPYCTLTIARRKETSYWATKIKGKTVLVHRLIAELILKRPLTPDEQVHHIDGNGLNNAPGNLEVMHKTDHGKISYSRRSEEPF